MVEADDARVFACAQCGVEFKQVGKGRPRARCYTCSPFRPDQRVESRKKSGQCLGCGEGLPNAYFKRCAPCNKAHYRAYHHARWLETPKWERPQGQCDLCGSSYTPHVPTQRYCSKSCRAKADTRRVSDARPLYRYARWLHIRKAQLSEEPTCRFCRLVGIETQATVCDHIHPHRGDVEAFWSGPFQSLCTECHNRDKQRMERRAA
jgi:5-methylcytosine-specific restriction protein A